MSGRGVSDYFSALTFAAAVMRHVCDRRVTAGSPRRCCSARRGEEARCGQTLALSGDNDGSATEMQGNVKSEATVRMCVPPREREGREGGRSGVYVKCISACACVRACVCASVCAYLSLPRWNQRLGERRPLLGHKD